MPPSPPSSEQTTAKSPSFDIVRVEPTGDSVVAARVAPNADVVLLDNGTPIARGKADANGQIALIPPSLKPGDHSLVLSMTPPGGKEIVSAQSVVVSVPVEPRTAPLVALIQPNQPAAVLSGPVAGGVSASPPSRPAAPGPGRAAPSGTAASPPARVPVIVRSVEVESMGSFYASGKATPGSTSRVYLNGAFVAAVPADLNGTWSLKINRGMKPGHYAVRVDQLDRAGKVVARAEVPFDYPTQVAGNGTRTDLAKKNIASADSGGNASATSGDDGLKATDSAGAVAGLASRLPSPDSPSKTSTTTDDSAGAAPAGPRVAAIPSDAAGEAGANDAQRPAATADSNSPSRAEIPPVGTSQAVVTPAPSLTDHPSKPSPGDIGGQGAVNPNSTTEVAGSTSPPASTPSAPEQPATAPDRNAAIASSATVRDPKPAASEPPVSSTAADPGNAPQASSVPRPASQSSSESAPPANGSQPGVTPAPPVQAGSADEEAAQAIVVEELITAKVEQGNSLWRISRRMLGHGLRYTQIYAANTEQIRDPRLIYPGQVFVMPQE